MDSNGQIRDNNQSRLGDKRASIEDFVLDKSIFSNIFEKDIKRVYIYKKSERLAKAIHLVGPAFYASPALRDRLDKVAVGLVDAATESPIAARTKLSRELLALSSVLSIARTGGLLSSMNAELIAREAQSLLQEVASYEEPRLFLDAAPTLAELARDVTHERPLPALRRNLPPASANAQNRSTRIKGKQTPASDSGRADAPRGADRNKGQTIGQPSDKKNDRQEAILSILRNRGSSYIKDISTIIRDVSEKTIQRELQDLVEKGTVNREGERRWTTYSMPA